MKKKPNSSLAVLFLLLLTLLACNRHKHEAGVEIYTCPMHPDVMAETRGTCPVCGMDLVRKAGANGEAVPITPDLAALTRSANEKIKSSIQTVRGQYRAMPVTREAKGTVAYDTRYVHTIPSRVGGRLEKVYLRYYYQLVKQGQKVAEIYSPELVAAQREWLYLITHDASNIELITLARNKLLLLGLTEKQIQQIQKRNEVLYAIPVFSTVEGYVVPPQANSVTTVQGAQPSGGGGMDGMAGAAPATQAATPTAQTTTGTILREGDYVTTGETLFRLASASALRVELNLPAAQAVSIQTGTAVKLDFENGNTAAATVDFVQPFFEQGEAFVKIRVYTRNTGDLHIGHFVRATFTLEPHESLWLPRDAVLDLGLERVVFVSSNGTFSARQIETGIRTKDWVEIRKGIASADDVAANAHYLVDSESFIKPGH